MPLDADDQFRLEYAAVRGDESKIFRALTGVGPLLIRTQIDAKRVSEISGREMQVAAHLLGTLVKSAITTWTTLMEAGYADLQVVRSDVDSGVSAEREDNAGRLGSGKILGVEESAGAGD